MKPHVCPASHAGFLASSLRRMVQKPESILRGLVEPGQTVVDVGCGPGFFTLPMAKMVGEGGTVIAADLQPEMLERLRARAEKQGIRNTIHYHVCGADRIGITMKADFVLAFYMVHEVPDPGLFFRETRKMILPGGRLLYVEPKFHVTRNRFRETIERAEFAGWRQVDFRKIALSRTALLE